MMIDSADEISSGDIAQASLRLLRAILRMCLRNGILPPGMTQDRFDAAVVQYDIKR